MLVQSMHAQRYRGYWPGVIATQWTLTFLSLANGCANFLDRNSAMLWHPSVYLHVLTGVLPGYLGSTIREAPVTLVNFFLPRTEWFLLMDWRRRLPEDGPRDNSSPAWLNYQRMNTSPCERMLRQHESSSTPDGT